MPSPSAKKKRRGGLPPLLLVVVGILAIGSAVVAGLMLWPKDDTGKHPLTPPPAIPERRPENPTPKPNPHIETPPHSTGTGTGTGTGDQTNPPPVVPPVTDPPKDPVVETPPITTPPITTPPDENPPDPKPPVTSTKTKKGAKAAREALDAFLAAGSLDERLKHAQTPEAVEAKAKAYYEKHPLEIGDAKIEFKLSSTVPNSDREFHIFQITTAQHQDGFPVSVEETDDGPKVDWGSFVEFHDNALGKFINIYHHEPDSFHCIVERAHYFRSDVPDVGNKICLRVQPPIPGYEGYAFIDGSSPLAKAAEGKFEWDHMYFPVLKLKWVRTKEGHQYIEILDIVQDNWRAIR